jgi:hypothetical protein
MVGDLSVPILLELKNKKKTFVSIRINEYD